MRQQIIRQISQPRRCAKHRRRRGGNYAKARQQRRASVETDQRIIFVHLKSIGDLLRLDARECGGITAQWLRGIVGQRAAFKQGQTRDTQTFRTVKRLPGGCIAIAPISTGTRIEQHTRYHQIDSRLDALDHFAFKHQAVISGDTRPSIHATRFEMPPAAVIRHLQIRIAFANNVSHIGGRCR